MDMLVVDAKCMEIDMGDVMWLRRKELIRKETT